MAAAPDTAILFVCYIDDVHFFGANPDLLNQLLEALIAFYERMGLRVKASKSKYASPTG